jgi:hypothetical protein
MRAVFMDAQTGRFVVCARHCGQLALTLLLQLWRGLLRLTAPSAPSQLVFDIASAKVHLLDHGARRLKRGSAAAGARAV